MWLCQSPSSVVRTGGKLKTRHSYGLFLPANTHTRSPTQGHLIQRSLPHSMQKDNSRKIIEQMVQAQFTKPWNASPCPAPRPWYCLGFHGIHNSQSHTLDPKSRNPPTISLALSVTVGLTRCLLLLELSLSGFPSTPKLPFTRWMLLVLQNSAGLSLDIFPYCFDWDALLCACITLFIYYPITLHCAVGLIVLVLIIRLKEGILLFWLCVPRVGTQEVVLNECVWPHCRVGPGYLFVFLYNIK